MARAFSLLALLLMAGCAMGQTFGRFGYAAKATVPGWIINNEGFKAKHALADTFRFPSPAVEWKPTETSAMAQTVSMGVAPDGGPSQLGVDLSAPGFSLYFDKGIDLKIAALTSPILSWPDGSVTQSVPTPAQPWILVSFRTNQPPVLLVFPEAKAGLQVDGQAGNWRLHTAEPFQGWVRVILPLGETGAEPGTASGLGQLTQRIVQNEALWVGSAPKLIGTRVSADNDKIVATWTYDKPGALIPGAALLAGPGGYPIHINSQYLQVEGASDEGPMAFSKEASVSIRFPALKWPECRYLSSASEPPSVITPPLAFGQATELALQCLASSTGTKPLADAGNDLMQFLSGSTGDTEPVTGIRLAYSSSGQGYDLTAAHALLTQALAVMNGPSRLSNPLLDQVRARVDSYTWMPWAMEEDVQRRAAADMALACAMRADDEARLAGAMLQAGLSAQRGYDLWRRGRGDITKLPPHLEVMEWLRGHVFSLSGTGNELDTSARDFFGPIRSCTMRPVAVETQGDKLFLTWVSFDKESSSMEIESLIPLKFGASKNLASYRIDHVGTEWLIFFKPKDSGACALELKLPEGVSPFGGNLPRYVEELR